MENQFAQPKTWLQRFILAAVVVVLMLLALVFGLNLHQSDPYVQEVLALDGNLKRGHEIFQINCAGCHGWQADGNVGPSLHDIPKRKSKVGLIYQVTSGTTPPMPKFQPDPQEMADLLSYLEEL